MSYYAIIKDFISRLCTYVYFTIFTNPAAPANQIPTAVPTVPTSNFGGTTGTGPGMHQSGVPMSARTIYRRIPWREHAQMKPQWAPGFRIPICSVCITPIRGPFVLAMGKSWCPDHFICTNSRCQRSLIEIGFVGNGGHVYCENCYEAYLAPTCSKCALRIERDCVTALDKKWHPNCFVCGYCCKTFGNSLFYMEDALPYCKKDWNKLFTPNVGCGFPIKAEDC